MQLLRGKINSLEQTVIEISAESNKLRDDLEQSMTREMLLIDELR